MEIVQRILGKIVGEQVSAEELELVSGGLADRCAQNGQTNTWSGGEPYAGTYQGCDD
jgi:hypothetical protein